MLAYANRVYFPVIRRSQNAGRGDLTPNFVWEIGGGQPVYSGPAIITKDNAADVLKFAQGGTR